MKSFFALAFIIFTLTAIAAGQYPGDEPVWTAFQAPKVEFSVDFPGKNVNGTDATLYKMTYDKTYFFMFVDADENDSPLSLIKSYATANSAEIKDVEIDGHKGVRYDFRSDDGYEHALIAIQAPVYHYLFHVVGESRDELMFEKFLGSIKFSNPLPNPPPKPEIKEGMPPPSKSKTLSGILKKDTPPGLENDLGVMSSTSTIAPPKYTKITSGVAVTGKMKPDYTEMARRYRISGVVRLRISFEKNAKIGEIKPLSKLPFGLTASATRAARQIKFIPALREGEPYTVTKNVEFSFNLY